MPEFALHHGDCLAVLPTFAADSFDTVITDPPYHLTSRSRNGSARINDPATPFGRTRLGSKGFMGKTWDGGDVAFRPETWQAVLRVAKPGAFLLSFGGPRTFHRLAVAIEDGGWEITDTICWLFGQGFPKARSSLKPAWEPIIVARKYADRVREFNIDAGRIEGDEIGKPREYEPRKDRENWRIAGGTSGDGAVSPLGRWPANVAMDEAASELLDQQTGTLASGMMKPGQRRVSSLGGGGYMGNFPDEATSTGTYGDSGGASRFFYCSKASKAQRNAGLNPGENNPHPTVKPLDLMAYLCKLTSTPTGGSVLDPFTGSGTTGMAAMLTGRDFTGIERCPAGPGDENYVDIARRRIEWAQRQHQPQLFV